MIGAGDLDRRITVRRLMMVGRDPYNEPIYEVADFATLAASRADVSDAEMAAAGTIGSALRSRFVVRSSANSREIVTTDTLEHEGATWNIEGIKETRDGRGRFLEITAVRGE